MHSPPAKVAIVAVRDEVAAAAVVEEVTATAPEIPVVVQVEPRGAATVETATTTAAEAAAAVAVASTCLLTAVFADDRGAIGETTAQRRRATSYPGVLGAQVLATKRVSAHRTQRY